MTRRERFLAGMDAVVLWTRLVAFIEPHETTVLRFRHLLEQHQLTEALFAAVRGLLAERRLLLQAGTIVDATVIAAPSSTKNAQHARDPERPPA